MALDTILVKLWGQPIGALSWDERAGVGEFQYTPEFVRSGLEVSPLQMPLRASPYSFPEHLRSDTFNGLPGMIADSLPEKFGNRLLNTWLAKQGRDFASLSPVERLCYLGSRGMGALEFEPDLDGEGFDKPVPVEVNELVAIAEKILTQRNGDTHEFDGRTDFHKLIVVGTSAGGAKAKAVVAWNEQTNELMSGQADCPPGFAHWLIKFDEVENEEHATARHIGRIEMAYHQMAVLTGIEMTECRLMEDGDRAHFMTRRFDRDDHGNKYHVQTFCGMDHADRNPPGQIGYERLFSTARKLNLGQAALDQLYLRCVFNILSRNQDDHSKNHAFMMGSDGVWHLTPAYDVCYSYKPGSRWIDTHQMTVNVKRDNFTREDLYAAAKAADVKYPDKYIEQAKEGLSYWEAIGESVGLSEREVTAIRSTFREL